MGDKLENSSQDLKGRAKEAVGALSGDDELKKEGEVDQAKSSLKDKVDDIADKIKDKLS